MLRRQYGFEVTLLLNPTRSDVIRALDKLRGELTQRDNLLIYYAGHGVLDVEADIGFWMSVDAEEGTQADWISIGTITGTVRAMSAKHVMVVSDSCYSGRLTRGLSVSVKTGSERVAELKRLAGKRSRTALVSGGLEPVSDGGGDGHSVFTRAFLTALRESTEVLDGQQLFTAVRRPVIVNADQTPEYSDILLAGHDGGDFLFVPVSLGSAALEEPSSEPAGAATSALDTREIAFWNAVKESARAADFEAYIEQYPDGIYAALALNRIEQFREELEAEPAPQQPVGPNASELAFWNSAEERPGEAAFTAYLERFPEGTFAPLARLRLDDFQAQEPLDQQQEPQETALAITPGLTVAQIATGAKVTYDSWKYQVTGRTDSAIEIDADGDKQRLLFGLIRIGHQALQEEHELTIREEEFAKLAALFPLQTGHSASFKLKDNSSALSHEDRVKVRLDVRDRTQVEFEGNTYEVWVIDALMKLNNAGTGSATIQRRFLYSDYLGITLQMNEELDLEATHVIKEGWEAAIWRILTHGSYVLRRID